MGIEKTLMDFIEELIHSQTLINCLLAQKPHLCNTLQLVVLTFQQGFFVVTRLFVIVRWTNLLFFGCVVTICELLLHLC